MAKPNKLETTPDTETPAKESSKTNIAEALHKRETKKEEPEEEIGLVSFEEYTTLLTERPRKFTPEQVGFEKGGGKEEYPCGGCLHFYRGVRHNTCEIVRTADDQIDLLDRCLFWTDGVKHPLVDQLEAAEEE